MFTPLPDGRIQLDEPIETFVWFDAGIEFRIVVPEGFVSDGASIPRCFWWLVGPPIRSNHLIPAVTHDYLCKQATSYQERILGDAVFRMLLKDYEVPIWKRLVMYAGVRVQGLITWSKKSWRVLVVSLIAMLLFAVCLGAAQPPAYLQKIDQQYNEGVFVGNFMAGGTGRKPLPKPRIVIGSCEFVRAKDADTYVISVTREINVRADKCWAPETKDIKRANHISQKTLGLEAQAALQEIAKPGDKCRLEVLPDGDKDIGDGLTFGRVVGAVYLEDGDGRSLGEITNDMGLTFETKAELETYLTERDTDERFVQ